VYVVKFYSSHKIFILAQINNIAKSTKGRQHKENKDSQNIIHVTMTVTITKHCSVDGECTQCSMS